MTNHYVTFPVIFLMLSAHFPMIYGDPLYLPIIFVISACLVFIKYMMNVYHQFDEWLFAAIAAFVIGTSIVLLLMYLPTRSAGSTTAAGAPALSSEALAGKELFGEKGCMACHQPVASSIAPSLYGVYGNPRTLASGESVVADEAYLRESIFALNRENNPRLRGLDAGL